MNFKTTKSFYLLDFSVVCCDVDSVIYYSAYNYENTNIILPINSALIREIERLITKQYLDINRYI